MLSVAKLLAKEEKKFSQIKKTRKDNEKVFSYHPPSAPFHFVQDRKTSKWTVFKETWRMGEKRSTSKFEPKKKALRHDFHEDFEYVCWPNKTGIRDKNVNDDKFSRLLQFLKISDLNAARWRKRRKISFNGGLTKWQKFFHLCKVFHKIRTT